MMFEFYAILMRSNCRLAFAGGLIDGPGLAQTLRVNEGHRALDSTSSSGMYVTSSLESREIFAASASMPGTSVA